jgi:hypothetical protein
MNDSHEIVDSKRGTRLFVGFIVGYVGSLLWVIVH